LGWLSDVKGGRAPILLGGIVALGTGLFGYYASKRFMPSDVLHASLSSSVRIILPCYI